MPLNHPNLFKNPVVSYQLPPSFDTSFSPNDTFLFKLQVVASFSITIRHPHKDAPTFANPQANVWPLVRKQAPWQPRASLVAGPMFCGFHVRWTGPNYGIVYLSFEMISYIRIVPEVHICISTDNAGSWFISIDVIHGKWRHPIFSTNLAPAWPEQGTWTLGKKRFAPDRLDARGKAFSVDQVIKWFFREIRCNMIKKDMIYWYDIITKVFQVE